MIDGRVVGSGTGDKFVCLLGLISRVQTDLGIVAWFGRGRNLKKIERNAQSARKGFRVDRPSLNQLSQSSPLCLVRLEGQNLEAILPQAYLGSQSTQATTLRYLMVYIAAHQSAQFKVIVNI